jgi:hypothetical protein
VPARRFQQVDRRVLHGGLPIEWTRVLERHAEDVAALPGYVWLDTPRKVLHVVAGWLEFREDVPV